MNKTLVLIFITLCFPCLAMENILTFELKSHALSTALPATVHDSNPDAPADKKDLLVVLDGNDWFLQTIASHKFLRRWNYIPDAIVVGVSFAEDQRRDILLGQKEQLSQFIDGELPKLLGQQGIKYKRMILMGWQYAGSFSYHHMTESDKIEAVIAASPYPSPRVIESKAQAKDLANKWFHMSVAENEGVVRTGTDKFFTALEQHGVTSANWHYRVQATDQGRGFAHRATPINGFVEGLQSLYGDFPAVAFATIDDFNSAGGIEYLKKYYANRAKKYGFSEDVPPEGTFNLMKLAADANDFPLFKEFDAFLNSSWMNAENTYWAKRWAQFALDNGDKALAKKAFEEVLKLKPQDEEALNKLKAL